MVLSKFNGKGRFPVIPANHVDPNNLAGNGLKEIIICKSNGRGNSTEDTDVFYPSISLPATDSHPSLKIKSTIPQDLLLSLGRQEYKDYLESLVPGLEIFELSTEIRSSYISSPPSVEERSFPTVPSQMSKTDSAQLELDLKGSAADPVTHHPKTQSEARSERIKKAMHKLRSLRHPKADPKPIRCNVRIPTIHVEEPLSHEPTLPTYFPYTRYVPTQIPGPIATPKDAKPRREWRRKARQFHRSLPRLSIPASSLDMVQPVEEARSGFARSCSPFPESPDSVWDMPNSVLDLGFSAASLKSPSSSLVPLLPSPLSPSPLLHPSCLTLPLSSM